MVTKQLTIEAIRRIVAKHYNRLIVSVLGRDKLAEEDLKILRDAGFDVSNNDSLLSLVYYHNFINHPIDAESPKNIQEMESQQGVRGLKPEGEANQYTVDSTNDKMKQYIEKMKLDIATRVEGLIRDNNDSYKMDSLRNMNRTDELDELVKESTIGKLRQKLRDTSHDANRDWTRIAVTEMSNAIGVASVDRIVTDNRNSELDEVYVYRVIVKDERTCKYCRRFYQDEDGSPKVYKLSTLLGNGSNYGKKRDDWTAVAGATHPNERCSQVLELKPGWKLGPDGDISYLGLEKWNDYIVNKVSQ